MSSIFQENYFTHGMLTLVDRAFRHLGGEGAGSSVFLLSQAMGGGKTHSMIALGLLAKDPVLRRSVLGQNNPAPNLGRCRVIGFNGSESHEHAMSNGVPDAARPHGAGRLLPSAHQPSPSSVQRPQGRFTRLSDNSTGFREALQLAFGRRYNATGRPTARPWPFWGGQEKHPGLTAARLTFVFQW